IAHLDAQARLNTLALDPSNGYRPTGTPTWSAHPTVDDATPSAVPLRRVSPLGWSGRVSDLV
ncbi:hypothetical protein, partial [Streptomyces melanogenes]|uniref:hypothetical protein n=1 Tax=Streptomyces melanogenes TaxID=67326 RepID=UPI001E54E419